MTTDGVLIFKVCQHFLPSVRQRLRNWRQDFEKRLPGQDKKKQRKQCLTHVLREIIYCLWWRSSDRLILKKIRHLYICVEFPKFSVYFTFMLPRIVIDLFLNNQPDALIIQIYSVIKLYMFWASSLPISRSFLLQFHPDSTWKRSSKTYVKLTSAECTVENSWWWAEKMPETCRVL